MASLTQRFLLLQLLILSVSTISTNARPCKTLFISSYSFSFKQNPNHQNPSSSGFVTVFTEISHFNPRPIYDHHHQQQQPFPTTEIFLFRDPNAARIHRNDMPLGLSLHKKQPLDSSAYDFSSLRDRTKDILSVVVALLFGVGCGALTAATMYLAWSVFFNRFSDYRFASSFSDDDDNDDDDDVTPKKLGYVKIPAPVPAPAKETV
jgi:hypothetical protein